MPYFIFLQSKDKTKEGFFYHYVISDPRGRSFDDLSEANKQLKSLKNIDMEGVIVFAKTLLEAWNDPKIINMKKWEKKESHKNFEDIIYGTD